MWIATWLSQNNSVGKEEVICKSDNRENNQTSSHVAKAKAWYYALEERETVVCFLDFP